MTSSFRKRGITEIERGDKTMSGKVKAQTKQKPKQFTVRLPDDLHRKMKAKCALEGKPIGDVVTELIKRYVEVR